jgi:hypothetical protein
MKSSILFLILLCPALFSQNNSSKISGLISDKNNNQPLSNCNIFIEDLYTGTTSDINGFYSLNLPPGNYKILFSYVGYNSVIKIISIEPAENELMLNIFMEQKPFDQEEITVVGKRETPSTINQNITAKDIRHIPNVFSDPVRTVQIFAGVSTNNELSSSYNVRGGSYEENLIYLNGYEIYRPFLLRAGTEENQSLLNPDMIDNLSFFNGAFPANYGDKMSSALDVNYIKEQNTSLKGRLRLDLMNGGIMLCKKFDKLNIITGFRYAYPGLFLNTLQTSGEYKPSYSDIQLLANYNLSKSELIETFVLYADNIYNQTPDQWTGHLRTDRGAAYNQVTINYNGSRNYSFNTNLIGVRYDKTFNENLRLSVTSSRYGTEELETTDLVGDIYFSPDAESPESGKQLVKTRFEKNDNSLKLYSYSLSPKISLFTGKNEFNFGAELKFVDIKNVISENAFEKTINTIQQMTKFMHLNQDYSLNSYVLYSQNRILLANNWITDVGFRFLHYEFTNENLISPRITISFYADSDQTFNFSWGYFYQPPFVNELKYMSTGDLQRVKSQRAIHYVFGWEYYFKPDVRLQIEAYYKNLKNLYPFYFENIKMIYLDDYTTEGSAFGFDVMFQGEIVKGIDSWLGYSYLDSQERYSGSSKPYRRRLLDQTHTMQIFLQDRIPNHPNWKSHLKFLFGSGFLFNPRQIVTNDEGQSEFIINFDNPEEYLIYFRVDMGVSAEFNISENDLVITAEVLNLFNQFNIAGYEWIQLFSDYQQPIRIPQILSKRFFNIRMEWGF